MEHIGQSSKINSVIGEYSDILCKNDGQIHRIEDWGKMDLSYTIKKCKKAHYLLINAECDPKNIAELKQKLKYSTTTLRFLVLKKKKAIKELSPMIPKNELVQEIKSNQPIIENEPPNKNKQVDGEYLQIALEDNDENFNNQEKKFEDDKIDQTDNAESN